MDDKTQVLEKTLHIENILKKYIKDSQNSTKIGATNIFLGNYLDSKLKLSRIVCLFVTKNTSEYKWMDFRVKGV